MELSRAYGLSPSGGPHLYDGETLCRLVEAVDLYDCDVKVAQRAAGIASVTTHRVLWMCSARRDTAGWLLADVASCVVEEGGLFTSRAPKAVLRFSATSAFVKFAFKCPGAAAARDAFVGDVARSLARRAWAAAPAAAPDAKRSRVEGVSEGGGGGMAGGGAGGGGSGGSADAPLPPPPAPRLAGIAGVLAHREDKVRADRALAASAFSGIKELAEQAQRLVAAAESYAGELRRNRATAPAAPDDPGAADEARMGALLADMGVVGTPITRALAGGLYLEELARQVAAFMAPRLRAAGGLAPLADVYCAYNRARGLDVVSPEDLLAACALLPRLRLGVATRELAGGLTVLALDSLSDAAVLARLVELLGGRAAAQQQQQPQPPQQPSAPGAHLRALLPAFPPLPASPNAWARDASASALDVALAWNVPLPVARAHLRLGEAEGVLCRDAAPGGTRYYLSRFAQGGSGGGAAARAAGEAVRVR